MSSIIVTGDITPGLRDRWPLCLAEAGQTVFADNAAEIIERLIPDYASLGNDDALIARWESAIATATDTQALICADMAREDKLRPADMTEADLTAIFGDRLTPIETAHWPHDVPLVLLATDYEPFTNRPPVAGNVLWVDPSDEISFLTSLANLGVIEFYAAAA
ncbi:MAG: hypothetical protein ACRCYU_02455 [Nocardioides sp.]